MKKQLLSLILLVSLFGASAPLFAAAPAGNVAAEIQQLEFQLRITRALLAANTQIVNHQYALPPEERVDTQRLQAVRDSIQQHEQIIRAIEARLAQLHQ